MNGSGSALVDIDTDGMGDFVTLDVGDTATRVYEVAGTTANIFVTGNSHAGQVIVRLFGR